MNKYDDSLKVKDALQIYFSRYHFADGGYNLKWFRIKLGPIYIPVPNTKGRIAAVKLHDVHHLLTEYTAYWKGEVEIGAWELASGCGKYTAAWVLNFGSFTIGLFLYPKALLNAFLRGRRMKNSLYSATIYDEAFLNKTVGELREYVGINPSKDNSMSDYVVFSLWCTLSIVIIGVMILCCYSMLTRLAG